MWERLDARTKTRRWVSAAAREAYALERKLRYDLGFGVAVYPVVVLWADLPQGQLYVGEVSVVGGLELVDWLCSRPADLLNDRRRREVCDSVSATSSMELAGLEPATSWVRSRRSPS
jgi:hypothetical protein